MLHFVLYLNFDCLLNPWEKSIRKTLYWTEQVIRSKNSLCLCQGAERDALCKGWGQITDLHKSEDQYRCTVALL